MKGRLVFAILYRIFRELLFPFMCFLIPFLFVGFYFFVFLTIIQLCCCVYIKYYEITQCFCGLNYSHMYLSRCQQYKQKNIAHFRRIMSIPLHCQFETLCQIALQIFQSLSSYHSLLIAFRIFDTILCCIKLAYNYKFRTITQH